MTIDEKKLDANELDAVSGGQIIEGKDGKFYVTTDENVPTFDTEDDAKKAQKLVEKAKKEKRFPFIWPQKFPENRPIIKRPPFISKQQMDIQPKPNEKVNEEK